jgi:hypothetical protein
MAQMVAKNVCAIARQQTPPTFVATARDADTDTCRAPPWTSAAAAISRYDDGWARVSMRFPQPRPEAMERVERAHQRQIAAAEKRLERSAQAAEAAQARAAGASASGARAPRF